MKKKINKRLNRCIEGLIPTIRELFTIYVFVVKALLYLAFLPIIFLVTTPKKEEE